MGAMKSLLGDDDRSDLLKLMSDIARARDEYREDLYRERDLTKALLWALRRVQISHGREFSLPQDIASLVDAAVAKAAR